MKERIIQFLNSEKISPAEFADKIGVQRSSMSHILNGRNYPSAAFLQKMLQIYPRVNPRWLMIGEGVMNSEDTNLPATPEIAVKKEVITKNPQFFSPDEDAQIIKNVHNNNHSDSGETDTKDFKKETKLNQSIPVQEREIEPFIQKEVVKAGRPELEMKENESRTGMNCTNHLPSVDKEIEQVIFFYKDKSFTVYRPN
jgi:transcriptional regulator with XRE-family HTH domain